MRKLRATLFKDLLLLIRDRMGLVFMFGMPILLALVITALQNRTFELVNDNKVPLLLCNKDTGETSRQLISALEKVGIFDLKEVIPGATEKELSERMHAKDALVAIVIPYGFSGMMKEKAANISGKALAEFGVDADTTKAIVIPEEALVFYYHPVLHESFRQSVRGSLRSALQLVQSREVLRRLYFSVNEKELPSQLENELLNDELKISEIPVLHDGSRKIPNATQHNIPAWTIFAMFFVVVSLGSSIVKEKLSGSFVRLKTMPTNFMLALVSKQIMYLLVTLLQAAVIFSVGIWIFPSLGLPALALPADLAGLFLVTLVCGLAAVSFALCIGVYARTQEQANGFGAVSVVLLAAIGGLLVPSFAMPDSFSTLIKLSPLHWCLEAFYGLFLEGGKLKDVFLNIIPLFAFIVLMQVLAIAGLKRKNLI